MRIAACHNCYRAFPWNGTLQEIKCPNCKSDILTSMIADSLLRIFFAGAERRMRWEYELLKYIAELGWGDAMCVGRHHWVIAGCPVSVEDFCKLIEKGNDLEIYALSAFLGHEYLLEFISNSYSGNEIGLSIVLRLKKGLCDQDERERLYYLLRNFPVEEGIKVLEDQWDQYPNVDGDTDKVIGKALQDALQSCKNIGIR